MAENLVVGSLDLRQKGRKMSQGFYEFTIGINVWTVYAVVAAIILAVMGLFRYEQSGYNGMEVSPKLSRRTIVYVIAVLTTLLFIMLAANMTFDVSPFGFIFLVLVCILFGVFLYFVAYVASLAKAGWLYLNIQQKTLQKMNIERAKAVKLQRLQREQEERYRREARRNVERKKRAKQQSIETRSPRN